MELDSTLIIPQGHLRAGVDNIRGVVYDIDATGGVVYACFGSNTFHADLMAEMTGSREAAFHFREGKAIVCSIADDESGMIWAQAGAFIGNQEIRPTPFELDAAKKLLADFTLKLALRYMPDFFTGEGELVDVMPLVPTEKM